MARKGWSYRTTLLMVLGTPLVAYAWIGLVEWLTLTDATESNHITAAFRRALDTQPELFVIILLALTVFYVWPLGVIVGHVWNRWGWTTPRKKDW